MVKIAVRLFVAKDPVIVDNLKEGKSIHMTSI